MENQQIPMQRTFQTFTDFLSHIIQYASVYKTLAQTKT